MSPANPVARLHERYQSRRYIHMKKLVYQVSMIAGQCHAPIFLAKVTVDNGIFTEAPGNDRKMAKERASLKMLEKLDRLKHGEEVPLEDGGNEDFRQDLKDANPVGRLQEHYQKFIYWHPRIQMPIYQVDKVSGKDHDPTFRVILTVTKGIVVTATGPNKKAAKSQAAVLMLQKLQGQNNEDREGRDEVQQLEHKLGLMTVDDGTSGDRVQCLAQVKNQADSTTVTASQEGRRGKKQKPTVAIVKKFPAI